MELAPWVSESQLAVLPLFGVPRVSTRRSPTLPGPFVRMCSAFFSIVFLVTTS